MICCSVLLHAQSLVCCAVLPSLPSQPGASGQDSTAQPSCPTGKSKQPTNELDDLTLRFEALKKR